MVLNQNTEPSHSNPAIKITSTLIYVPKPIIWYLEILLE